MAPKKWFFFFFGFLLNSHPLSNPATQKFNNNLEVLIYTLLTFCFVKYTLLPLVGSKEAQILHSPLQFFTLDI